MKYDKKWRGGKEPGPQVSVKIESDTESEPVITDNSAPLKIAEELEGKIFPPRRRRKSSGSTSATKAGLSPSPRSRSRSDHPGARSRLKLSVGAALSGRKVSHESQPTPIPTLSEVSEPFLSPRSPLMDILNVRDISEVIDEDIEDDQVKDDDEDNEEEEKSVGRRLSDLIIDNIELQKVVIDDGAESVERKNEKESNPFHFNSTKLKSFDKSDSEPKKSVKKTGDSNRRRNEILESISNSVIDEFEQADEARDEYSDEGTLKEELQEKKPRRKWNLDPPENSQPPVFNFPRPPLPQESSFESSCYYCRNVCRRHQSLMMMDHQDQLQQRTLNNQEQPHQRTVHNVSRGSAGVDVGVQAGKSTIHHYLFDPTEDAVFDDTFYRPAQNQFSGLELPPGRLDLATNSIIDLMKRQLEMAEHQMRSQKMLYRSFCRSLEKTQTWRAGDDHDEGGEKVLFGRSKRPEKLTFDEALSQVKQEMKQQRRELRSIKSKSGSKKKSKKNTSDSVEIRETVSQSIAEEIHNYENDFEDEESEIHTETVNESRVTSSS